MHKERILALADLIETQPHTSIDSASGFNMDNWTHSCGTPACIAGWGAAMYQNDLSGSGKIKAREAFAVTRSFLDLTSSTADELFVPRFSAAWETITPAHAAATLRHLAATGIVDWSATLSNDRQSVGGEADV